MRFTPIAPLHVCFLRGQGPNGKGQHQRHCLDRDEPQDWWEIEIRESKSHRRRIDHRDDQDALCARGQDELLFGVLEGVPLTPSGGQQETADDGGKDPSAEARNEIRDGHEQQNVDAQTFVIRPGGDDPFEEPRSVVFFLLEDMQQ